MHGAETDEERESDEGVMCSMVFAVHRRGVDLWLFVLDTIDIASDDDDVLRFIGAGELESLVMWHGTELIDDIEARAPSNRALRVALSDVWGTDPANERIARLLEEYGPPSRYWVWEWQRAIERISAYEHGDITADELHAVLRALIPKDFVPQPDDTFHAIYVAALDALGERGIDPTPALRALRSAATDRNVEHRARAEAIRQRHEARPRSGLSGMIMRMNEQGAAIAIRPEADADHDAIASVVARAFGSPAEAALVEAIRASPNYVAAWSLVATVDDKVVGHVMASYVTLRDGDTERGIPSLSPLAVDPDTQRRGIGGALVRALTAVVDADREPLIVLEGSPGYYSRFGFEYAAPLGITITLPDWAPPEAAQVLRLKEYDPGVRGQVVYPPAFDPLTH